MAFQDYSELRGFLNTSAAGPKPTEASIAANFLLEERLSPEREGAFDRRIGAKVDDAEFHSAYGNYFEERVGVPTKRRRRGHTFADVNRPALKPFAAMESHSDVVRLESMLGLFMLNPGDFDSPEALGKALEAQIAGTIEEDELEVLHQWLEGINRTRDARPMFAAPWGELEDLLAEPNWPRQLRNSLGLVHLGGTPEKSCPVLLMRYNLSRAEDAARQAKAPSWVAAPTVLEAGTDKGPNTAFFPFPEQAIGEQEIGFGQTVDLGNGNEGLNYKPELVHFRIDYELADFRQIGYLTDRVDDAQLAEARARHLALLENDFKFRNDLP